jgi:hypothetical protein
MSRTLPRTCLGCGGLVRGRSRHPQCERPKAPTATRGYGSAHQRLRAALVAALDPWQPCPRCGEALGPDPDRLDLGHVDGDRSRYSGLEHRECNRGRRGADQRVFPSGDTPLTRRQPNTRSDPPAVA